MLELANLIGFLLFFSYALAENTNSLLAYQWSRRRNDTVRTPARLVLSNEESLLSCSIMCQTLGCIYITFDSQTKVCEGYLGEPAVDTWKRQCPDGYAYNQTVDFCYKYHSLPSNWTDAKDTCASEGSILFVIYNQLRSMFMLNFSEAGNIFWVGGTDLEEEGTFKWIDGADVETSIKWHPGEPNNADSAEHCMTIVTSQDSFDYYLNDDSCAKTRSFVCAH